MPIYNPLFVMIDMLHIDHLQVVMRRIVDDNFAVKFPPYLSPAAKDFVLRLLERKPTKRLGMLQVSGEAGQGGIRAE